MALFRGLGARKDTTRGTTPIEVRKVLAGMFSPTTGIGARSGILLGAASPLVTGNATWAYNVGTFHAYVSRSASDGGQLYGNDATALIGATGVGSTVPIAPGAGLQRIDIIWTRHPTNTENADTASEPLFGVASGADAVTAVAPTIPTGAIELARNLMTNSATSTVSAGNTITQTALYTALRGADIPVRNQTERDALGLYSGLSVYRLDTNDVEAYNGAAWVGVGGLDLVANVTVSGSAGIQINDCFSDEYDCYRIIISNLSGSVAGSGLDMRLGSNVNLANYSYVKNGLSTGGTANSSAGANVASWGLNFLSGTIPGAHFAGDIIDPFVPNYTCYNGIGYGGFTSVATWFGHMFAGHYNALTSFTGCYLFPTAGTFSCNVKIYGYRKS